MAQRRAILWCKLTGRLVKVLLEPGRPGSTPVSGVSAGWQVMACADRNSECYGTGCPMTTDGGDCPFGELGELPGGPSERFDPLADPSFESEWE